MYVSMMDSMRVDSNQVNAFLDGPWTHRSSYGPSYVQQTFCKSGILVIIKTALLYCIKSTLWLNNVVYPSSSVATRDSRTAY